MNWIFSTFDRMVFFLLPASTPPRSEEPGQERLCRRGRTSATFRFRLPLQTHPEVLLLRHFILRHLLLRSIRNDEIIPDTEHSGMEGAELKVYLLMRMHFIFFVLWEFARNFLFLEPSMKNSQQINYYFTYSLLNSCFYTLMKLQQLIMNHLLEKWSKKEPHHLCSWTVCC